MMLPGNATLRVQSLPLVGWKTAVGFEVSTGFEASTGLVMLLAGMMELPLEGTVVSDWRFRFYVSK